MVTLVQECSRTSTQESTRQIRPTRFSNGLRVDLISYTSSSKSMFLQKCYAFYIYVLHICLFRLQKEAFPSSFIKSKFRNTPLQNTRMRTLVLKAFVL